MTAAEAFAIANQYFSTGQFAAAEHMFRNVLMLEPSNAAALHALGIISLQAGNAQQAVVFLRRATESEPASAAFWNDLGVALNKAGDYPAAAAAYEQALHLQPEFAGACNNLGFALLYLGDLEQAVAWLEKSIRLEPNNPDAFGNLGTALKQLGKREEAVKALEQAVRLDPNKVDAANLAGIICQELGDLDRAIELYRHALRVRPDYADATNNLASALKEQGFLDEAVAQYREALRIHPDHVFAYYNLSQFVSEGRYRFTPEDLARMRALLASDRWSAVERSVVGYAMGAALDAQGAYEEAFRYYEQANELRREWLVANNRGWDVQRHRAFVSEVMATFDRAYFQKVQGWGTDTELPIFVLGMPRSGTTLVSHILASHPAVFGAGELGAFPQLMAELAGTTITSSILPKPIPFPNPAAAADAAARYLQRVNQVAKGAPRVATKTLENFVYLGLIATLLPRARVIYCRRDPLDVCLSCYFQNFQGMDYSCSLQDIGSYYRQYERLMAHWGEVLPLPIFEVRYEDLLDRQEDVTRGLLAHCGLDWDEHCLTFYNTRHPVQTASTIQVRKPLSTKSVGRWKNYRSHLKPLLDVLEAPEEEKTEG